MLSFNRAHRKQLVAQRDVGKGGEFSSNALGHCELLVLAVLLTSGDKYKHRHLYLLYLFILTVLSAGSAFISIQVRWSIIAVPLSLNPLQYRKQRKRLVAMGGGHDFPHYLDLCRCLSVCSGSLPAVLLSHLVFAAQLSLTFSVILTLSGLSTHGHELTLTPRGSSGAPRKDPALLTSPLAPYFHGC